MLQRVKRITSHTGLSRFLTECDETTLRVEKQEDIPSPYSFSPDHEVYRRGTQYLIIVETAHRRYDVFAVPESMLRV